jgi:hypothetical protein
MKKILISGAALLAPLAAFAQSFNAGYLTGPGGVADTGQQLANYAVTILSVLIVAYFIWSVISYVISGDDKAKEKARTHIIYGIIGMAVVFSIWGIINVLQTVTGTSGTTSGNICPPGTTLDTSNNQCI